jgi:hypothetical protein
MKSVIALLLIVFFFCNNLMAQQSFVGIAKYKMTVIGASDSRTDSMKVVFGTNKIKTVFYLPSSNENNKVITKSYIDNFSDNTTADIDDESKTYELSTLNRDQRYRFVNTNKFEVVEKKICITYDADKADFDNNKFQKIECLASVDFLYRGILNYFFYGIQPIIIDNRIVFDFTTTEKEGKKSKIFLYEITAVEDVEAEFNLNGLKEK